MSVPGRGTPAAAPAAPVTASDERLVGERDEFGPGSAAKLGGDLVRAADAFTRRLGGLAREAGCREPPARSVEIDLRRYSGTIRGFFQTTAGLAAARRLHEELARWLKGEFPTTTGANHVADSVRSASADGSSRPFALQVRLGVDARVPPRAIGFRLARGTFESEHS